MSRINENKLAKEISEVEGKKVQVNIAQIKEVIRCEHQILAHKLKMSEITECAIIEMINKKK